MSEEKSPDKKTPAHIALGWWAPLADRESGDRATMARLRRCQGTLEAMTIPATLTLARRLKPWRVPLEEAAGLARLLAHVRENDKTPLMRAAGWKTFPGDRKETEAGEDRPLLSGGRFRRLLQTTPEERADAFVRLVQFLGGTASVYDLAESYLDWRQEASRERRRQRWAYQYFATSAPGTDAPDTPQPAETGAEA